MKMKNHFSVLVIVGLAMLTSACSNGGNLSLEPGAITRKVAKGSPFVSVNQGGKALIVESGQTATTGVHGYVTIQAVTARSLASSSTDGTQLILNKSQAQAHSGH